MRAISTFILEDGIWTRSCSAWFALRMRVSMSPIGSLTIVLPAALGHARDDALVRELAQADAADAELSKIGPRPAAALAAGVVARRELLRPRVLDDERFACHEP